ncbi:MAG: class I SAM-dependent methyltransferase [Clostridia bacterium]|nr:class I SAM-dependent methyltransferase [Clostridia bacterium]
MKIPISKRLLCCASMVLPGARVADIGTDHGYLPIYLLQNGIASSVYASDLREKPLQKARDNAQAYGVGEKIRFLQSDGLHNYDSSEMDTVICAGMGGDLICLILDAAPWLRNERYTLILQPQSGGQDVRRYLSEHGFYIVKEQMTEDAGFLYSVMLVHYGKPMQLTPGQQFFPYHLLTPSPYNAMQYKRLISSLQQTVSGMEKSKTPVDAAKKEYYASALRELKTMEGTI